MVSKTPPPAVLVLGLPLAGIASLRSALETLGHKDIYGGVEVLENPTEAAAWGRAIDAKYNNVGEKWPLEDLDVVLAGHDVVMDMPCTAFAEDLIAAYPKAKVILTELPPSTWYTAFEDTVITALHSPATGMMVSCVEPLLHNKSSRILRKLYSSFFSAPSAYELSKNSKSVYEKHNARIKELVPPDRLLVWRPEDGYAPLCMFLGEKVPEGELEVKDEVNEFWRTEDQRRKKRAVGIGKKAAPWLAAAGFALAAWSFVK